MPKTTKINIKAIILITIIAIKNPEFNIKAIILKLS